MLTKSYGSCQSFSVSDKPSLFSEFAGMEQETEIELPLVTLEQGRVRSLPEFGETGTVAIINNNSPHAMLFLLHEIDGGANRKTHWFVSIFCL